MRGRVRPESYAACAAVLLQGLAALVRQLRDGEDVDEVEDSSIVVVCCVSPLPRGRR
jgi:hypothetical protein